VNTVIEGDRLALRVRDDGVGMPPEKIQQLLTDRQTLDGELHSLGFVFVRQTVAQFGGDLAIESAVGRGTTMTLRLPYLPGKTAESLEPSRRDKYRLPEKYRSLPAGAPQSVGAAGAAAVAPAPAPEEVREEGAPPTGGNERMRQCGKLVFEAYRHSKAQFAGCIFAIAVTEEDRVEMFTVKPYERDWDISHEDLSPMHFQETYRGRLEEDELKRPTLIIKPPQSAREYFEFKEVPEANRGLDCFTRMVRDEGVRVARKLIATGLDPQIPVHLGSARQFFAASPEFHGTEPFPLELLARQRLSVENGT
jgi:hypothetical protein